MDTVKRLIVAIDGPSGAGKGTVARALARLLGYRHIDTGAMYRAVAWLALERGIGLDDEAAVAELAERSALEAADQVTIDGHDVTRAIRTPAIDAAAARVARLPLVRAALVARQRALGRAGGIVMEGRDIGTVVFPDADVKVFLDADADERARRRASDPAHASQGRAATKVASALRARDEQDRTREVSPLARAADALLIDTTGLPIDDVVNQVSRLVRARLD